MTIRSSCLICSSRKVEAGHPRRALVLQQVAPQRVPEALRLLEDFLEHEVRISAPLHRSQVPLDLVDRLLDPVGLQVADPVAVTRQDRHLAIVEVHHRPGVLQQRRRVRGDEVLALTHPHQQRRALARRHDHVRFVLGDEGQSVGTVHFTQSGGDGFLEAPW